MKTINYFILALAVFVLTVSRISTAQNNINAPDFYNLNSDGNQSNVKLSTAPPETLKLSAENKRLMDELESARTSGNITKAEEIQNRLNVLNGSSSVRVQSDPRGHFETVHVQNPPHEPDYIESPIHTLSIFSNAVQTVPPGAPNAGRIWVASSQYNIAGTDTIKFYYSDNNGSSWHYYGLIWMAFDYNCRNDELDIELVYDGTDVWMFGVAGLTDNSDGRDKSMLFRFKTSGGPGYITILNFPGNVAGNNYYNPRLCSDNTNYTIGTYIYVVCSLDSLHNGSHAIKQKFVLLTSIVSAAPLYDYTQANGSSGFYWNNLGTATRIFAYGDIGYYRQNGVNRIMTVFSDAAYGFNSMYLAWSDNYGLTNAGNLIVTETASSVGARICFNGGPNYTSGMVSYVRQTSGTNWDPYALNTTTGGTIAGSWTGAIIDASTNRARTLDVAAIKGANNLFKAAYAQDNPSIPQAFYKAFNGSAWSATPFLVSNFITDTTYAKPRAGYINGGGDDCLTIWSSGPNGVNAYASILCSTTLGIENNQTPVKYSLNQNYPNPFNPATSIRFELPKNTYVKLTVYDMLGRETANLVDRNMNAGSYKIDFDASQLASGIYLYKLEAGEFSDVKKMALIK